MDITRYGLQPLGDYEPPTSPRPALDARELLLGIAMVEARAYREGRPERAVLSTVRGLLSDLAGLPPAMG